MPISWKTNKRLRPEILLDSLSKTRNVSSEGVSFSGIEIQLTLPTLQSMLDFPVAAAEVERSVLIRKTLASAIPILTRQTFIAEINRIFASENSTKETVYRVLTSLSFRPNGLPKQLMIEGSTIKVLQTGYPKKYSARGRAIANAIVPIEQTPTNYCPILIGVKSKSIYGAITKALRVLDIQRAIWCLFGNAELEIMGYEWKPINVVRLGGAHTIHWPDGSLAAEEVWFEPNFVATTIYQPLRSNVPRFRRECDWAMQRIRVSKYKARIVEALLRYVRALDERDQNTAFIKLWGAVESLASPDRANYDLVVKRCSFLFKDGQYNTQVLEHLREYRNESVHSGDQSQVAKIHCFQLQVYFRELILFHLRNARVFSNLDEANQFLDMSPDKTTLLSKKRMIQKAIKFVS